MVLTPTLPGARDRLQQSLGCLVIVIYSKYCKTMDALRTRPLLAIRADAALFVGRARELNQVVTALGYGWNVLVVGERGSGKTSLVRQIWHQRAVDDLGTPVFLSAAGVGDPETLLWRVAVALDESGQLTDASAPHDLDAALSALPPAAGVGPRPVIVLDDVAGRLGHALFGTLRDDLWTVGLQWLVSVDVTQTGAMLQPPADAFFEATVHLGPMSPGELEQVVHLRTPDLDVDNREVLDGISTASGNPRRVLAEARRALLTGRNSHVRREQALARLGRPAHMLYVELTDRGPVSASDKQLQERMGWTRPRLVQVLSDLEKAGLVTAATAQTGGAGRPRKMYAVMDPTEADADR